MEQLRLHLFAISLHTGLKMIAPQGSPRLSMWKLNQKSILCVQMEPLSWIQLWGKLQKQTSMRIFGWYTIVLPSTVVMLPRIQSIPSSCAAKTPHHFSSALSYSNGIQLKILLLLRKENPISSSVSVNVTKIIVLKVKP